MPAQLVWGSGNRIHLCAALKYQSLNSTLGLVEYREIEWRAILLLSPRLNRHAIRCADWLPDDTPVRSLCSRMAYTTTHLCPREGGPFFLRQSFSCVADISVA